MVREKSGKSQGILLYSNCGHPVIKSVMRNQPVRKVLLFQTDLKI